MDDYTGKNLNNTYQQYDILHETHTLTIRTNTTSRMFGKVTYTSKEPTVFTAP